MAWWKQLVFSVSSGSRGRSIAIPSTEQLFSFYWWHSSSFWRIGLLASGTRLAWPSTASLVGLLYDAFRMTVMQLSLILVPRRVDQRPADHRKQRRQRRSDSEAEVHYRHVLYIQVNRRESPIIKFNGYEVPFPESNLFRNRLPCKFNCLQRKAINFALWFFQNRKLTFKLLKTSFANFSGSSNQFRYFLLNSHFWIEQLQSGTKMRRSRLERSKAAWRAVWSVKPIFRRIVQAKIII